MTYRVTESTTKMPSILYGIAWKKERTADLVEQAIQEESILLASLNITMKN